MTGDDDIEYVDPALPLNERLLTGAMTALLPPGSAVGGPIVYDDVAVGTGLVGPADVLGIEHNFHQQSDVHIHVPEGATPKDGPSAGVGMCTALVSALTQIPVRSDVAMTGEITLRGRGLPIGGLKEKLLAALRGGLKKVIIPRENEKDLAEIPDVVKRGLDIVPVATLDQVLEHALTEALVPIKWNDSDDEAGQVPAGQDEDGLGGVVTH